MKGNNTTAPTSRLLIHIVAWVGVFLLPYVFNAAYYQDAQPESHDRNTFIYLNTVTKVLLVGVFYLNTQLLIARFFYTRRYVLYGLWQLVLFALVMLFHRLLFAVMIQGKTFNLLISSSHNILPFLFTLIASIAYKTIIDREQAQREANELARVNLQTELSFLRSQISPHFLFNIMNNIAAMVRLKSEELEPTVYKLSSLMHYMLYQSDEEKVMLQNEVENLQHYIDLQRQRFNSSLMLQVSLDVKENWRTIEPMLLIPFVENAFKHGTGTIDNPGIWIDLKAEAGHLLFTVKNKCAPDTASKDNTHGIGLANVKRRLELLYSQQHRLTISRTNDYFTASLELTFKS